MAIKKMTEKGQFWTLGGRFVGVRCQAQRGRTAASGQGGIARALFAMRSGLARTPAGGL